MGFMDKFKQIGEAAKDGMNPANIGVAADVNRLGQTGVATKAVLKSITPAGSEKFGGGTPCELELEVHPEGGAPYAATITQQLIQQSLDHYQANIGSELTVKVDPADPTKMVLWG
jgi:hypothetical protein